MAFPQILTFPTPLRGKNISPKRKLLDALKIINSTVVAMTKTVKRSYRKTVRQHYFLTSAVKDLKKAVNQNEDVVLASITWTAILVYAITAIAAQFVLSLSKATYAMSEANNLDTGLMFLAVGAGVILFGMLLSAASVNFMSLSIMDGANRKIYRSIRSTLRKSLQLASRVTSAWFLIGAVHLARVIAVTVPFVLYVKWFSDIANLSTSVLMVLGMAAAVWLLAGVVRYSMVPYVAQFEPQCLLTDSFERSRQLVNKQAAVFIVSGSVVFAGYLFGMYKLCNALRQWLGTGSNLLLVISLLAGVMLANGAMVMLYRKRKLARS